MADDDELITAQDLNEGEFCDNCGARLLQYGECPECDSLAFKRTE